MPCSTRLSSKLNGVFEGLRKRGRLSEIDIAEALREVRLALLEADVALPVVKDFIAKVREAATQIEVLDSVAPGQQVIKAVNDAMVEAPGRRRRRAAEPGRRRPRADPDGGAAGLGQDHDLRQDRAAAEPAREEEGAARLAGHAAPGRPAPAGQQLAQQARVASLPIIAGQTPVEIARRAMETGRREVYDVVILDTAGRLSIDAALMDEVRAIRAETNPAETLLVVDAMTGQDAVNTARAFNEALGITGIVMTRMDGDARGGAALSMRAITGAPIKLTGSGEKIDALEEFHPERVAGRILGMGDIVGLVEKAAETVDEEEAEKLAAKMMAGKFDLDDYAKQLKQITKMGSHLLHRRHAARHGPGEGGAGERQHRQDGAGQAGRDDLLHDDEGAAHARHHQGKPQEAHRRRVGHDGAGREQAAQAVRRHVHDDEEDAQAGPERPDAPRPGCDHAEGHGRQRGSTPPLLKTEG